MKSRIALAFGFWLLLAISVFGQPDQQISRAVPPARTYFPGDVVQIVVAAPPDLTQIVATMPDGQQKNLDYDQLAHAWYGHWEVPMVFKKGAYYAKLTATDVEGRSFGGKTSSFYIGEPALVTIIEKQTAQRFKPEESIIAGNTGEDKIPAKAAVKVAAVKKTGKNPEKKAVASRPQKEDFNLRRVRLITAARNYIARQEYEKAKSQIESLLKIAPEDKELKTILARIEVCIKAQKL